MARKNSECSYCCNSLSLLFAVKSKEQSKPVILLAIAGCLGMAGIDFYYSLNNVISKIYLLDGFLEIGFIIAWVSVLIITRNKKHTSSQSYRST
jgi:predicted membrane protein